MSILCTGIIEMRAALREGLAKAGSTRDWSHITDQIGTRAAWN